MEPRTKAAPRTRERPKRSRLIAVVVGLAVLLASTAARSSSRAPSETAMYPQGNRFPLVLYSLEEPADMRQAAAFGWNMAHTYAGTDATFLERCAQGGLPALAMLPSRKEEPVSDEECAADIKRLAPGDRVAWWQAHEELRYWRPNEMAILAQAAWATRKYDPQQRPLYMYLPGHYTMEQVRHYVQFLDIIPASVYTTYHQQPHAWVRWRMESVVQAIRAEEAPIGSDYLHGEKTPVAVLELFDPKGFEPNQKTEPITPAGTYHDFWQCIVSGAQGILVFSYYHRKDLPELGKVYDALCKAASEIAGPEQLGQVILRGKTVGGVNCQVTAGQKYTVGFKPYGAEDAPPISYPSVDLLAKEWSGDLYVIAVNSSEQPVSARIAGLPAGAQAATVLFEDRLAPIKEGAFEDEFPGLGVHIYKLRSATTGGAQ